MHEQEVIKEHISYPISLDFAKKQLTVDTDFTDDDVLIQLKIEEAIDIVEDMSGRDIALKNNTQEILDGSLCEYLIREASFVSLESISYNYDGVDYTVDLDSVKVYKNGFSAKVIFDTTITFDSIEIKYKSGYTELTLPRRARAGTLIKINDLYDIERTSQTIGTNFRENNTFSKALGTFIVTRF